MTQGSRSLVIVGAGGHARVVADIVRLGGELSIAAFLDDADLARAGSEFCGATIAGGLERLDGLRDAGAAWGFVAVGPCGARLKLAAQVAAAGFRFPVLRHPFSSVAADADVGPGTVIVAGAIVNPGARLGAHVIVNTGASVDHDCAIGDGVHVAPGARLAGRVRVDRAAWIGLGAVVRDGVHIGAGSIVGAGAVVLSDVPPGVVAFGSPARVMRSVNRVETVSR